MNNKFLAVIAIALSLISTNAYSQKKFTLAECIAYARENNLSVKQSQLNVEINERVKSTQFGNFLPNLGANGSYSYNKGFAIDPTTNQIQSAVNSFVFNASSQWNLFNGFQDLNNYRKAKFDLLAAQYGLENLKDNISLQVADAYLQIMLSKEFLRVAEEQVAASEKEVERLQTLVDSGARPKGDLFEAESTLASDEQQLVATQNNLTMAKLNLTQLLQIDFNNEFDIAEDEFPVPSMDMLEMSNENVYQQALVTQYIIKSQESRIESAKKDLNAARGFYSPTINLTYAFSSRYTLDRERYIFGDPAFYPVGVLPSTGEQVISLNQQSIPVGTEPYRNIDQLNDNKNHFLGLNINIPIFNRLQTKNNVEIKKLQLLIAESDLEIEKNRLRQNIEKAHTDAVASLNTYEAAEKSLKSFEEAFKYAKQKREVGMISEYDYNVSRTRLVSAQSNMLRAKYDFIFKIKVLEFYYGNRFGY